jgi:uncharacterized protein YyaL (SSP411 family)
MLFLLREHARTGAAGPREMVTKTLEAMALGGMRDHVGGGFHRYSVDGNWRVPHFEKMLYDQAQLVLAYAEAAQLTNDPEMARVVTDTLAYVRRDLSNPEGGFYSAEDADSLEPGPPGGPPVHKREGAFYVWEDEEIGEALGPSADIFRLRYGVLPDGNAPFDPQQEFTHKNLLYTARSIPEIASLTGETPETVAAAIEHGRAVLLERRARRPRPQLDDKVLTAWNGLQIAALARTARTIDPDGAHLAEAQRAAAFVRRHLWNPAEARLQRRHRQGVSGIDGYAEDYAFLTWGLLELFQADGDPGWLDWVLTLERRLDDLFWDEQHGAWFSTTGEDASVLLRLKEEYDGAEPSASAVAVLNRLTVAHLRGERAAAEDAARKMTRTFGAFGGAASMRGRAMPMMLAALSTYHAGMPQIVVVGEPDAADTRALHSVLRRHYVPTAVVVPVSAAHRTKLSRLLPWTESLEAQQGRATAYVCREFSCQLPTTSPDTLASQLAALTRSS